MAEIDKVAGDAAKTAPIAGEAFEAAAIRARDEWGHVNEAIFKGINLAKMAQDVLRDNGEMYDLSNPDAFARGAIRNRTAGPRMKTADFNAAIAAQQRMIQHAKAMASQYPKGGHEIDMAPMNVGAEIAKGKGEARAHADYLHAQRVRAGQAWLDAFRDEALRAEAKRLGEFHNGVYVGNPNGGSAANPHMAGEGDEFGRSLMSQIDLSKYAGNDGSALRAGKTDSFLADKFGPLSDFDAYREAFDLLSTTVAGSFSAWIDGSMGVGEAAKKGIAEFLKGTAIEASVNALKSLAMAATYAFTPGMQFWVPGALKSAAAWGAVAVAAGAGSRALGSGGGGSGGGATAPGGGISTGTGGSAPAQQGSNVTIVYGQDFTNQSSRQRALHAERIVNEAKGAGGVTYA